MRTIQKLAVCIVAGTIAFFSQTSTAYAAETPVAGINFFIQEVSVNSVATGLVAAVKSLAFANVDDYVYIRKKPDEESDILGKLYKNSAATILDQEDGWCRVKSGTVTGYIKSDFLATGEEAKKLSEKIGQTMATVTAKTLRVRSKASTKSKVVTLIPKGDTYEVTKDNGDWVKIKADGNTSGYVSSNYVKLTKKYDEAVSIKEESANMKSMMTVSDTTAGNSSENTSKQESISEKLSSLRNKIVDYALKFVGNPYRWGGTSLTRGADCSGFTQSIFEDYGIDLPRTSREQAAEGRRVSLNDIQPGDLIFYRRNGSINHVAIYIGNGKVVAAKSSSEGIRITKYNYRTPYKVVTYIG